MIAICFLILKIYRRSSELIDAYGDGYVVLHHHHYDIFVVSKLSNPDLETSKIVINGRKQLELLLLVGNCNWIMIFRQNKFSTIFIMIILNGG